MTKKHSLIISELREAYLSKELTVRTVLEQIKQTIKETQEYNIWIYVLSDEELEKYVTGLGEKDIASHPLWGIPFAIKDNIDLAGVPTTAACREYAFVPEKNAFIVEQLIQAGAIPIGKTNMDQFATGLVGTRSPYGEVHNAYRPELISGGSSSGSSVAVALGMAAFSLGTDTAGSGRVPAALNHLIGLKPSVGAWSAQGIVPACKSLDCPSVFANTLDDAVLVDGIIREEDMSYTYSKKVPAIKEQAPVTIYLPKQMPAFYGDYGEDYRRSWEKTAAEIKEKFSNVEYLDTEPLSEAAGILYDGPWVTERYAGLENYILEHEDTFFPVTRKIICGGSQDKWSAADLFKAMHRLEEIKKQTHRKLGDSVLVLPTCGGTFTREQVDADPVATNSQMGLYTNHCNLLDLCALAIPAGFAGENLPFGVTVFAASGQEGLAACFARKLLYDEDAAQETEEEMLPVAVCGLHMKGFPLEKQLIDLGGQFFCVTKTAPVYQMYELNTIPAKPGLVRNDALGTAQEVEIWRLPAASVGKLLTMIPAPLGLGNVKLEDGTEVTGFLCEEYAIKGAKNITLSGGWRYREIEMTA